MVDTIAAIDLPRDWTCASGGEQQRVAFARLAIQRYVAMRPVLSIIPSPIAICTMQFTTHPPSSVHRPTVLISSIINDQHG